MHARNCPARDYGCDVFQNRTGEARCSRYRAALTSITRGNLYARRTVTVATILETVLHHNLWANLSPLETCRELSDAQFSASAPDTYRSIHDTLVHVVGVEERDVGQMTN